MDFMFSTGEPVLTPAHLILWLSEVDGADKGHSVVKTAFQALSWLAHSKCQHSPTLDESVVEAQQRFDRRNRKRKAPRPLIEIEDILMLDNRPMPGLDHSLWRIFLWIMWTFGLRPGEGRGVLPSHIKYISRPHKAYQVTIVRPKIGDVSKIQHAVVPLKWMWNEACPWLDAFSKLTDDEFLRSGGWDKLIPARKLNTHLQYWLPKALEEHKPVIQHSLRHGRFTELRKKFQLNNSQLRPIGRWLSERSVEVYLHF